MDRFKTLSQATLLLASAALLPACGSGGQSASTSTVSAYVTDDLADYDGVELTLNSVQLRHTGGARECEIIVGPLAVDAAELGRDQILEHVDTTVCEAGPYNRLHVELGEDVTLTRTVNGAPQTDQCKFVSYYDDAMLPNRLACTNGVCSLDITGAVNLIAGNHEHVALDADLKEFTVDYSAVPCEVTLKVSPLHAKGMDDKLAAGYRKSISGYVSALDTEFDRFTLSDDGDDFAVEYAGVTDQTGVEELLARAANDGLKTRVRCLSINDGTSPPTCVAQSDPTRPLKTIAVMAKGVVSSLDSSAHTLDLAHNTSALPVNYHEAFLRGEVEGALADDVTAEVKLYGFDLEKYLALEVEVKD